MLLAYENTTRFNDFRVRADQKSIRKNQKIIQKMIRKKAVKNIEKSSTKPSKMELKTTKKPLKNRVGKKVGKRSTQGLFFSPFLGVKIAPDKNNHIE